MILTFDVPPLPREQGLCDIDSPGKFRKISKPIISQIRKVELSVHFGRDRTSQIFLYFSVFFFGL